MTKQISKKGQHLFALLLAVAMMFSVIPMNAIAVTSTNVNEDGYIEIDSIEDLYLINQDLTANYILTADIDMSEATAKGGGWDFMGNGWNPIGSNDVYGNGAFEGIFDGNGHSIIGMRIDITSVPSGTDVVYAGLFANVTGTVKNFTLTSGYIYYNQRNGYRIGNISAVTSGKIINCHNKNFVDVDVYNSFNSEACVGGIVGKSENAQIVNCSNTGSVKLCSDDSVDKQNFKYASGISGACAGETTISESYNIGDIYASTTDGHYYSGDFYYNYPISCGIAHNAKIINCYNTGEVKAVPGSTYSSSRAYGIGGNATCCYNIGNVIGDYKYSIASNDSKNCYYLMNSGDGNVSSTALTKSQMEIQSFYKEFDFNSIWTIKPDALYSYPQLKNNSQDLRSIEEVVIHSSPNKTEYRYGEQLNLAGALLKIVYDDETFKYVDITEDMVSGYSATTPGAQLIEVNYKGFSNFFTVKVNEKVFVPVYTIADLYNRHNRKYRTKELS